MGRSKEFIITAALQHGAPPLEHGGQLGAARLRHPDAPQPFLDLSTGINPLPYPVPPLPPDAFTRLPEPDALQALQAAAAAAYGVRDPAMVVAAPGTQVLIGLLPLLLPQRRVTVFGPTYAEHAAAWQASGAAVAVAPFPAAEEQGAVAGPVQARSRAAPSPQPEEGAAVLCNPNNPDGRRIGVPHLLALARRHPLLVMDEAFADFEPQDSLAPCLPLPGTVVLRSFGKAYGLAGLRLGFALAEPRLAARIRDALGPWAVSGPALHIGTAALADTAWRERAGARLHRDARALDAMLARAGLAITGGTCLFRLVETPDAAVWADLLGQAGILVRSFAEAPTRLRFGIPAGPDQDRLAAALDGARHWAGRSTGDEPDTTPNTLNY